jgi:dephospho-CoA kinase
LLKVGLTGGIAAGKSVAGDMLVALGAKLIRADEIAHQLMQPGQAVYREVVLHFGAGILNPDGTVNRSRLAEIAFGDGRTPSRIKELNQLVHPAVVNKENEWMEAIGRQDRSAVAVVEAALILEAGAADRFDRLIVVTCKPEQRVERLAQRLGIDLETSRKEVSRRMEAQLPDKEKIKAADYVIDNSGSLDNFQRCITGIYQELKQAAG